MRLIMGFQQTSFLYLNDGKGQFSELAANSVWHVTRYGMVTAAVFTDVNHDGWPDLVVAGEWMPITIFINKKGNFERNSGTQLHRLVANAFMQMM